MRVCCYGGGSCFISCLIINLFTLNLDVHDPTQNHNIKFHINGQSVCSEDNQDKEVNCRNVIGESNQLNTEL